MKRVISIISALLAVYAASAQSALEQARRMAGGNVGNIPSVNGPVMVGDYSDGYGGGGGYGSSFIDDRLTEYASERESAWEARKAARDKAKSERSRNYGYSRTHNYKLKDVKPIDPNAGKTLPSGTGAVGDLAVYAKYNSKGEATYGIWNTEKKKWQYKPKYGAINIVGPHAAAASLKGKFGVIDPSTGETTTDFSFDKYKGFHYPESAENTVIALGNTSPEGRTTWQIMLPDADGKYVQKGPECSAVECFEDGTGRKMAYRTADEGKVGMLNEFGFEVLPPVFDGLDYLKFTSDDASCYQSRMKDAAGRDRYGVVDEFGRSIVPCNYDSVQPVGDGKYGIKVVKDGKVGWYGTDGKEIFPAGCNTLDLNHFWDGEKHRAYFSATFTASDGKQYCALFDTSGRQLTDPTPGIQGVDAIKDRASQLEEYRIY